MAAKEAPVQLLRLPLGGRTIGPREGNGVFKKWQHDLDPETLHLPNCRCRSQRPLRDEEKRHVTNGTAGPDFL